MENEYSRGEGALKVACPTHSPTSFSEKGNLRVEKSRPSLWSGGLDGTPSGLGLGNDKTKNNFLSNSSLKWMNLFGMKPKGKSTSPHVSFVANAKTREYSIFVLYCIFEKSMSNMDMVLLGKFV